MKKIIWGIVIIVVILLLIRGINQSEQIGSESIKIGVLAPLTGNSAEHGEWVRKGIELAKDVLDENNIILIYEDSACSPKDAVSGFNKLIDKDEVDLVIGLVCSGDALAVSPIAKEEDITIISAVTSSLDLTDAGDHYFRIYPSDLINSDLMVDYVLKNDFKKVALISVNNDYGKGIITPIEEKIADRINHSDKFSVTESDFRLLLSKIKDSDLILFVGYPNNTMVFLKQKYELELKQKVVGSVASFTSELFSVDQVLVDDFLISNPDINPEGREKFVKEFKDKYGEEPKYPAEYGYDNLLATVLALRDSKYDISKIRESLYKLKTNGASGDLGFDVNGDREGVKIRLYKINSDKDMVCDFNCE